MDLAGLIPNIDARELFQEPDRVLRGRGAPLQLVEGRPVGPGAVGEELRGEDLPERRVVTAPANPGQVEIQCSSALFILVHGTHEAPPRIRPDSTSRVTRSGWRAA